MPSQKTHDYIGSYKVLNKIGEGGMALIFKALQPALKRTVVLKKLKDPNREIINRFKKEALLSASFHQENLVAVYDFIYTNRSYYLVMEYVDGEDLRTVIDYMAPLPASLAGLIVLGIVRGLEYTHARNIIHRDIKPGNILLSYSGDVKLIDFGVAKDDVSTRLTLTGMIVGTPAYMAPEQANGEPLSAASDLFSVGVLLYELLTGVKPFYGENNTEILSKIIQNKYIPAERINPDIPRTFRKIIHKALHKDVSHRYTNATEMISDLEKAIPWQVRSTKKQVVGRFLKDLDKTKSSSQTDPVKMQLFKAMPAWGWRSARYVLSVLALGLLLAQGWLFKEHQLGYVQLRTQQAQTYISLDGKEIQLLAQGVTELGPLLKGMHRLRAGNLQKAGVFISDLPVWPGRTTKRSIPEPLVSDSLRLNLNTLPEGADIWVNGTLLGSTPLQGQTMAPGRYTIEVRKTGFQPRKETIILNQGQTYQLLFNLQTMNKE